MMLHCVSALYVGVKWSLVRYVECILLNQGLIDGETILSDSLYVLLSNDVAYVKFVSWYHRDVTQLHLHCNQFQRDI